MLRAPWADQFFSFGVFVRLTNLNTVNQLAQNKLKPMSTPRKHRQPLNFRKRAKKRRRILFETLEDRRVLDASDAFGTAAAEAVQEVATIPLGPSILTEKAEDKSVGEAELSFSTIENASTFPTREPSLVIVDPKAIGTHLDLERLFPSHNILVWESVRDSIQYLASTSDSFGEVHILGHGSDAQLELGNVILSPESVVSGNTFLGALGESLNPTAAVYLYGCEVAETTTGKQFVSQFADVLNRQVFASVDVTGNSLLGGDWELEYAAGNAHAPEHSTNTLHLTDSQFDQLLATVTSTDADEDLTLAADNDTYVFLDSWGNDTIEEADSGGEDTIDFSAVTSSLIFYIDGTDDAPVQTVSDSSNQLDATYVEIAIGGTATTDTLDYTHFDEQAIVDLGSGEASGFSSVTEIENISGGDASDTLTGDDSSNTIKGGKDSDTITGAGGADDLYGDDNADTFIFEDEWGDDAVDGGAGDDTLDFTAVSTTSEMTFGISADNAVTVDDGASNKATASNVEILFASNENTVLDFSAAGSGVNVDLATGDASYAFQVFGMQNIIGSQYEDELFGDDGDNTLTLGGGDDTSDGGAGDDTYVFTDGWGSDTVNESDNLDVADPGFDTLDFSRVTTDLTVLISETGEVSISDSAGNTVTATGIESIIGGTGNDTLDYSDFPDPIMVILNADVVTGLDSISNFENVIGSAFADVLVGDIGDNYISGGNGNDYIDGLDGANTLDGGEGDDELYQRANANQTLTDTQLTITDSSGSSLVTNLSSFETVTLVGGNESNNIDASSFTGANGVIIDGGSEIYLADVYPSGVGLNDETSFDLYDDSDTELSVLNQGDGISLTADGEDELEISLQNGLTFSVDFGGFDSSSTVQNFLDRVNEAAGENDANFYVAVAESRSTLTFVDLTTRLNYRSDGGTVHMFAGDTVQLVDGYHSAGDTGYIYSYSPATDWSSSNGLQTVTYGETVRLVDDQFVGGSQNKVYTYIGADSDLRLEEQDYSDATNWEPLELNLAEVDYSDSDNWNQHDTTSSIFEINAANDSGLADALGIDGVSARDRIYALSELGDRSADVLVTLSNGETHFVDLSELETIEEIAEEFDSLDTRLSVKIEHSTADGSRFVFVDEADGSGTFSISDVNESTGGSTIGITGSAGTSGSATFNGDYLKDEANQPIHVDGYGDDDNLIGSSTVANQFTGGGGSDTITGGSSTDLLIETVDHNVQLSNTTLIDTENSTAVLDYTFNNSTFVSVDSVELTGSDDDDILDASGFSHGSVTLDGGDGDDTLYGGEGDDFLTGGKGIDVLDGGNGTDTIVEASNTRMTLIDGTSGSPYDAEFDAGEGTTETVTLVISDSASGTFTLTYDGDTTRKIDVDVSSLELNAVLADLDGLHADDVVVLDLDADAGSEYQVTFRNNLAGTDVEEITASAPSGGGSTTITTIDGNVQYNGLYSIESVDLLGGMFGNDIDISGFSGTGTAIIDGFMGDDVIDSTAPNLTNATIYGDYGHDIIQLAGFRSDDADGGEGVDTIIVEADDDIALTDELVTVSSHSSTLTGFEAAVLTGGASANNINASGFTGANLGTSTSVLDNESGLDLAFGKYTSIINFEDVITFQNLVDTANLQLSDAGDDFTIAITLTGATSQYSFDVDASDTLQDLFDTIEEKIPDMSIKLNDAGDAIAMQVGGANTDDTLTITDHTDSNVAVEPRDQCHQCKSCWLLWWIIRRLR